MKKNSLPHGQTLKKFQLSDYVSAFFLLAALWFVPVGPDSEALNSLSIIFISIVLEAIPFMFVGTLVGGLIEVFVSRERMASLLPQNRCLTVFVAAGAGIVFPVCECAVIPVVKRLVGKGLPLAAAVGYLLGGPIVNPIVAASTALAYAFDWNVVMLRMSLGYGIAVSIGLLMGRVFSKHSVFIQDNPCKDGISAACGCNHHYHIEAVQNAGISMIHCEFPKYSEIKGREELECICGQSHGSSTPGWISKVRSAFRHGFDDFLAVGHFLVIGAFIAAFAQTYIERSSFMSVSQIPVLSVGLMMTLAILLNLCSEADAFIAASFRGLMPLSAQMAFMLTGPMFDLKLLLMYQKLFQRKAIIVLATLILVVVMGISIGLEWLIRGFHEISG